MAHLAGRESLSLFWFANRIKPNKCNLQDLFGEAIPERTISEVKHFLVASDQDRSSAVNAWLSRVVSGKREGRSRERESKKHGAKKAKNKKKKLKKLNCVWSTPLFFTANCSVIIIEIYLIWANNTNCCRASSLCADPTLPAKLSRPPFRRLRVPLNRENSIVEPKFGSSDWRCIPFRCF